MVEFARNWSLICSAQGWIRWQAAYLYWEQLEDSCHTKAVPSPFVLVLPALDRSLFWQVMWEFENSEWVCGMFLRWEARRVKRLYAPEWLEETTEVSPLTYLKAQRGSSKWFHVARLPRDCGKLLGVCWLQERELIGTNSVYFKRPGAQTE